VIRSKNKLFLFPSPIKQGHGGSIPCPWFSLAGLTYYLLGSDTEKQATASVTNDENLFILSPDQVVDVYDGDTFKIDLPSMHPLFGDDLSIRLFGVDTPEMRGTTEVVKALAMQAQQVTEKALK